MPINSGYSFYEYAGDGVTTRFPIQFSLGELKRVYVTCRVDNEVDAFGAPLYRALADVPGDPGMIEVLGDVPGVGVPVVFRRIVPKELLLHLYANGSILDYPSLDESHLQLMMALHEVLDGYGLTNVFTDINMNGYKLTNVFSDVNDPDSIATVAFLGTYRQDALDAAIAAADSALEALGYRDAALGHANSAAASAVTATAQAVLASGFASDASGFADDAAASAATAGSAAADAVAEVADDVAALEAAKLDKDQNIVLGATVAASGTAVDFVGIPAGVKRITVMFWALSTTGTSAVQVQLGNSSGFKTTSYTSAASNTATTTSSSSGLVVYGSTAADSRNGAMTIQNSSIDVWVANGNNMTGFSPSGNFPFAGVVGISGVNRLRITTVNGTDRFDAGTINISWEF